MRAEELLEIIGEAKDEQIRDAKEHKSKFPRWAKWSTAIAACLCLMVGGIYLALFGGGAGQGGGNGDSDLNYMNYIGPVLPLTVQGNAEGITAQRNVNFDFSPYHTREESYGDNGEVHTYTIYDSESTVIDTYVLTNESGSDQTLTLLYPFTGDLGDWEKFPQITVNGAAAGVTIHPGPYSGGFEGAWGAKDQATGSVNLDPISSFEGYAALLADGSYLNAAFDAFPELNQPVVVYRLHDFVYTSTDAVNPSLCMSFYIDYEKTMVFSYGMNGMSQDIETGYHSRQKGAIEYRPDATEEFRHPDDGYVIVLGEDIKDYTIQGYQNMGCHEGEEVDDLGCTVTRYETTLGEIIRDLLHEQYGKLMRETEAYLEKTGSDASMPLLDFYCGLVAELLVSYGPIGDNPKERYGPQMLGEIFSAVYMDSRVIYQSFTVTVPQGGSTVVEVTMKKDASMDFIGNDKDRDGYDMATTLGSTLQYTDQTASISGYDDIEIVGQNFGFDLANAITNVTLDLTQPHYWLEIRKLQTEE